MPTLRLLRLPHFLPCLGSVQRTLYNVDAILAVALYDMYTYL